LTGGGVLLGGSDFKGVGEGRVGVGAMGSWEGDRAGELGAVSRLTEARREGVGLEGARPPPPMILSMEKFDTLALGRGDGCPRGAGDS